SHRRGESRRSRGVPVASGAILNRTEAAAAFTITASQGPLPPGLLVGSPSRYPVFPDVGGAPNPVRLESTLRRRQCHAGFSFFTAPRTGGRRSAPVESRTSSRQWATRQP